MRETTRTRPNESIELFFLGPVQKKGEAIATMQRLGFVLNESTIPWREALGVVPENEMGIILKGARTKEGLTQRQLAEAIGLKQHHISEIERGKRTIGREIAKRLGKTLNLDYRIFL